LLKGRRLWFRESGHAEMKMKTVIRSAFKVESKKWDAGRTNKKRENMLWVCACMHIYYICMYIYIYTSVNTVHRAKLPLENQKLLSN
jgi:preprotein translocase subunit SecY